MEIIKISDKSHFDMAVSLLEEGFTETRKSWERLFSVYIPPQGNFGLLAIENGVAVGVILIFISNIKIYQEQAKVVNLSAWYVRKDYRYIALKLITLILKEYGGDDTIFVNLTASQRVQEDTLKFARIMEGLGTGLLDSLMTLIAFTPILWGLSKQIDVLPWIGQVDHALVWVAIISALGGTILLALIGVKLPGIEYDIQKEEAGYRKELVMGEDDPIRATPATIGQLYNRVRGIHFRSYFNYLYFNAAKWSYFQGMVIVPYLALAPTIVAGGITLGFVQQIIRAFGRVEGSLQYLVKSWSTIVELISVWKRLMEFEAKLKINSSEPVLSKSD